MLFAPIGLSSAYEYAKVMHRDVSTGNILIDMNESGVLVDWSLCCYTDGDMSRHRYWGVVSNNCLGLFALVRL